MNREEWLRVFDERGELLEIIGAKSVNRAKVKLDNERKEFNLTKEQLRLVVEALDVDNWKNAIVRAKALLDRLEKNRMPQWITTISPHWKGVIRPTQYKACLRFCQDQFLQLWAEMEAQKAIDPDFDIDSEMEKVKQTFLTTAPGQFVELIADFIQAPYLEGDEE